MMSSASRSSKVKACLWVLWNTAPEMCVCHIHLSILGRIQKCTLQGKKSKSLKETVPVWVFHYLWKNLKSTSIRSSRLKISFTSQNNDEDYFLSLHFHFSLLCIGEGNGNPLQCSCLENPRDRVAQSQTWLRWLSSSSSFFNNTIHRLSNRSRWNAI